MKVIFGGDISFDWLNGPGPARVLANAMRASSFPRPLKKNLRLDSRYSFIKDWYRRRQAEVFAARLADGLQSLIGKADGFCVNLECPFSFRGRAVSQKRYTLRAEPYYAAALRSLGVTHVGLANNHILDFGPEALDDTGRYLGQFGIIPFGLRSAGQPQEPAVLESPDGRAVLLGYVEPSIITPDPDLFLKQDPAPCPLDADGIVADIDRHKKDAAVIVILHWGVEWSHLETSDQRSLARRLIDAGASAVIGHHPHMVGSVEEYRHGLIAYSLGNLMMVLPPFAFKRSAARALVELTLGRNRLDGYRLIPLDYDRQGFPLEGSFRVESLRRNFRPAWQPLTEAVVFDSFHHLPQAKVTLENKNPRSAPIWKDDHLVIEDVVPLYRLPMGPGWRFDGTWSGTAQSRELLQDEFLDINTSYLGRGQVVRLEFQPPSAVSKLTVVAGYPEALAILKDFTCPELEITGAGRLILQFPAHSNPPSRKISELVMPQSSTEKITVTIRGGESQYGMVCWRVWGI